MSGKASQIEWDSLLAAAAHRADIRAGFRIVPCTAIEFGAEWMRLDGVQFGVGPVVGAQIRKATELAIFVASVGSDLDAWATGFHLQDDEMLSRASACLCDFALQSALEWIERRIADTAKSARLGTTNRFSPGFCTWPAGDQAQLLSMLPQGFCGVLWGKEGAMRPRHSVSGVIGFGPEARRLSFHCQTCPVEECHEQIGV